MATEYEVREVRRIRLNGRALLHFELWRDEGPYWVFQGVHTAPIKTPVDRLVDIVLRRDCK